MKIDLTGILSGRESRKEFEYTDSGDAVAEMIPGIKIADGGVKVRGRISNTGGCMILDAEVLIEYTAPCDRCLEETEFRINFELKRVISAAAPEERESSVDGDEWDGVTEDIIYVSDGRIELDGEIAEAAALEMPMRNLCSEDCPGLCPVCGKKLGGEHSGCAPQKEIDPRLSILKKLLEKSDEK